MKHTLLSIALFLCSCIALPALEITSDTRIVTSDNPDPVEKMAMKILCDNLQKIFGISPEVVAERKWDGKQSAIILGRTEYAEKNIKGYSALEAERWHIQAVPEIHSLVITGGWPRGTLFGVYDFLEYAGFRYFDLNEKHVPPIKKITISDNYLLNKKPYFSRRFQFIGMFSKEQALFSSWHKLNVDASPVKKHKELFTERQDGLYNTFYRYGKDFPEDKPEYFSLCRGIRLRPVSIHGPGQFCYTHPDVRRLLKEKLKARVDADKEYSRKNGYPPMRYYLLSINDCETKCECQSCMALAKKYSAYSGAHLDFINDIASVVPEVTVVTRAYKYLLKPPKGIGPAANVKLSFAILGAEFPEGMRDTVSPLTSKINAKTMKFLEEWHRIGGMFDIWDYQRLFGDTLYLYTNIPTIVSDAKTYAELGIKHFFAESEYGFEKISCFPFSFQTMSIYISAKMMEDPYRDADSLIDDFMDKYYGAAGPYMKRYYNYLVKRQAEVKIALGSITSSRCAYLDPEFFSTVEKYLSQAETAVGSDPVRLRRVRQEWFPVDIDFLRLWQKLKRDSGKEYAHLFDVKKIQTRIRACSDDLLKKYYPDKAVHMRKTQNAALDKLLTNCEEKKTLPLPEQFRGKNAVSISAADFKKVAREQKLTDDPEAASGKAMAVEKWFHFDGKRDPASLFAGLPSFGIQDRTRKCTVAKRTLKRNEIPADEKYHLYLIGRSQIKGNVIVFAHGTWYIQVPTKSAFSAKKPNQFYDFWISLKLQGPAYVPGSKRKNAFIVDRVILVPSEKQ